MSKERNYNMENLGVKALNGRKVLSALINDEKDLVVLNTDKGKLYLSWVGGCCSSSHIEHVSGLDALLNATVVDAEHSEWIEIKGNEDYDYHVIRSMGTKLRTDKGWVDIETRHTSNGYYSGWVEISDQEPVDQYSCPRFENESDWPEMKPLSEDF